MNRDDKRPRLDDILAGDGSGDNFDDLWNNTEAAGEFEPLPAGTYRCIVTDGRRAESKTKGTPSYKVTFEVVEPRQHAGRKVWLDCWLTPKALPTSKRELAKLGIHTPAQLRQPPPTGMVADVKVALRSGDGRTFNRVTAFEVIAGGTPPGALDPDDDEGAGLDDAGQGVPF